MKKKNERWNERMKKRKSEVEVEGNTDKKGTRNREWKERKNIRNRKEKES